MNPQYPGYAPPNQQQFYGQPQQYYPQPQQFYGQPQQSYPQQQCYMQPQPQFYAQPQQQCYMEQQIPPQNYVQQPNYIQAQHQGYIQQQCYGPMQQPQFYNQEPQQFTQYEVQSRQINDNENTPSCNPSNQPVAYVSQCWNTAPEIQQITGKPTGPIYPEFYFVFTPSMFTDSINPWTAAIWLQSFNNFQQESSQASPNQSQIETHESTSITKPPIKIPHKDPVGMEKVNFPKHSKNNNSTEAISESKIFKFDSIEQFQKLRHHATIDSALRQLHELGTDLSTVNPRYFTPDSKSCFICCNSYVTPKYQLGVGPINDGITVAANHKYMGYTIYFLHNPHQSVFLDFLKVFLQKADQYLTVFFSGHGAQIKDTSGDEEDGYDEVMVFDSGYIVDDDLAIFLRKYSLGKAHTILLTDCCHSGTIWDIPERIEKAHKFPANIMSVSSSQDSQTSKQAEIQKNFQGVFTFNFWTLIRNRPSITIVEAQKVLNSEMHKYNQELVMYPTRKEMLNKPIFPLMLKH